MQEKDFYIRNGQLFGPLSHRGIPVSVLRDAIEWIAWAADGDGAFHSGEMREDMGIPRNQASTILGALSSIGAVDFVSRRMGFSVTDDSPDGWINSLSVDNEQGSSTAEHQHAEPSAPIGYSTTVNVPLTASDRDLQRMVNICRKLNVSMTMY